MQALVDLVALLAVDHTLPAEARLGLQATSTCLERHQ